jgi:hypothetical protein|tara:strand:- start:1478 stop:2134 length:657 start_codon:yes stop_codon:yes gene_type:complete
MFKSFLKKIYKKRDIRFLDAESYKFRQAINSKAPRHKFDDESIEVEKVSTLPTFDKLERSDSTSFLELIRQATTYNTPEEQHGVQIPSGVINSRNVCDRHLNSLGVFSDSKIYSALIHSILSKYDLDIQHFNHPSTFKQSNYSCFDSISTWIVFLSDEQDSDFLDHFLDRYVEKPTLFLFSKVNRGACIGSIGQFIKQNNLEVHESDQELEASILPSR